jgi:long-chain acyl-CoA synthetase
VVGVPATGARAALGELIKAVVVPREGAPLTELDIKRHCAQRRASYKVPHLVEFRDALPRNPSGKVLKRELV